MHYYDLVPEISFWVLAWDENSFLGLLFVNEILFIL